MKSFPKQKLQRAPFRLVLLMGLICTGFFLVSACGWLGRPAEPEPARPTVSVEGVYVHGESALILQKASYAQKKLFPQIQLYQEDQVVYTWQAEETIDQGLLLWQIPEGDYLLRWGDLYLTAAEDLFLPEGYTLTRKGTNQHWRFYRQAETGFLGLTLETVTQLPQDIYDVFIDVGHGGTDPGASGHGLVEAEQNRMAALYLEEQLTALGLKVTLSRRGPDLPGGEAAEQNPYVPNARIDQAYRSQAKYILSSHLNAGGGSGFQLYTSFRTSTAWGTAVRQQLLETGWHGDDGGLGWVDHALYKRTSAGRTIVPRDYYFIIRETGGYALSPYTYRIFRPDDPEALAVGAETLLLEYAFLDNQADCEYWNQNWKTLVEAVAAGSADYWQLSH